MGRSPKPLRIAVTDPDLLVTPEVVKLVAQGHTVEVLPTEYDLCIGARCWYMPAATHVKYLDLALKAARLRAYPPKEGEPSE